MLGPLNIGRHVIRFKFRDLADDSQVGERLEPGVWKNPSNVRFSNFSLVKGMTSKHGGATINLKVVIVEGKLAFHGCVSWRNKSTAALDIGFTSL
jgi:hypothetical protein